MFKYLPFAWICFDTLLKNNGENSTSIDIDNIYVKAIRIFSAYVSPDENLFKQGNKKRYYEHNC